MNIKLIAKSLVASDLKRIEKKIEQTSGHLLMDLV